MKRIWVFVLMALLLTGCAGEETMETIADEIPVPVMAQPRQIAVELPEDIAAPVLEGTDEQIYLCNGYEIVIETLPAGDLDGTIRAISGYEKEELTVLSTQSDGVSRYEFVWASAGEGGDRLGRGVILDDGNYHYCMTILRDASTTEGSQIVWRNIFSSFKLV